MSKILIKRANHKELVSKIVQISISNSGAKMSAVPVIIPKVQVDAYKRMDRVFSLEYQEPEEESKSFQVIPSPHKKQVKSSKSLLNLIISHY